MIGYWPAWIEPGHLAGALGGHRWHRSRSSVCVVRWTRDAALSETARLLKMSAAKVSEIKRMSNCDLVVQ